MPKLPAVSGDDVLRLLHALGYRVVRQRGSHIRLKKTTLAGEHAVTVPAHKVVADGTLNDILNRVSLWNGISKEELIRRL